MHRNTQDWIEAYQNLGALWIHDDNPKRPHALLTSGKHSNGFFNSRPVIADESLLDQAASDLTELLVFATKGDVTSIDGVVGPQTGATKLSQCICDHLSGCQGQSCFWASPAKTEVAGVKSMTFSPTAIKGLFEQKIILCEDVLTTGGSVDLTEAAVASAGGIILPFVLVLVNRSGLSEIGGKRIIALIDRPMPMWNPDECPLCAKGSQAVRPKDNWAALNAVY